MKTMMVLCATLLAGVVSAATYYVDASRPDDSGDGLSWATAKQAIQAAVDLAGDGDTVLVTNDGGGAYCRQGGVLSGCTLYGNQAGRHGGGVMLFLGGALTNCLLAGGNTAHEGGGVYCWRGGAVLNCTISSNSARYAAGGVCTTNGGSIVNSIVYFNDAGASHNNWRAYLAGNYRYCATVPTNGLPNGDGCTDADPGFVAAPADYRLQFDSPCVDSGENHTWMDDATDLDGNPRIYNAVVDMGCYEFVPEPGALLAFLILAIGSLRWNLLPCHTCCTCAAPVSPTLLHANRPLDRYAILTPCTRMVNGRALDNATPEAYTVLDWMNT